MANVGQGGGPGDYQHMRERPTNKPMDRASFRAAVAHLTKLELGLDFFHIEYKLINILPHIFMLCQ